MKKAERAEYILEKLAKLYPDPPIPLDHTDPYTLLIAVLLSAQSVSYTHLTLPTIYSV